MTTLFIDGYRVKIQRNKSKAYNTLITVYNGRSEIDSFCHNLDDLTVLSPIIKNIIENHEHNKIIEKLY